jgi:hypothetical protein
VKISTSRKILLEELPSEVRKWFGTIQNIVNPFFDQVYQILSNGITIGDNLKAQKVSIKIQASQVYPVKVSYRLNERPYAVILASISEDVGSTQVVQNFSFNWYYVNGNIEFYFSGLDAAKAYTATFFTMV